MTARTSLALFGIVMLLGVLQAAAATITVDIGGSGDYLAIDEALVAAAPGDMVFVLPGTYLQNIVVDKALTLISSGGSALTTIAGLSSNDQTVSITVDGVVFEGFSVTAGSLGLDVADGVTDFTVVDITIHETGTHPVQLPLGLVPEIVPLLNLVPHASERYDAVVVLGGTIATSTTWPVLPAGFVYYISWATITVRGPTGPVLTIPSGEIIKLTYSRFEIGSNTEPGGLVADGVTFTSVNDDLGGDSNGGTTAPSPGNWQRLDFNAMARADSCLITNCEIRYGGNGVGVIHVAGSDPTITGNTFTENTGSFSVDASPTFGANLTGNTLNQGNWRPIHAPLDCLDNLVFGNTIVPRGDGKWNGIDIPSSTITESWTLPMLPHGFLYYFNWATITVSGPAGPVLTIPSGEIIKLSYSRFEIGSNTEPGGLVADGVTFTSVNDDLGGDTNGGTVSPNPGNWQRLDFNAMARADSCLITNCEIRYGGNGVGAIHVVGSDPTITGNTFTENTGCFVVANSATFGANLTGNTLIQGNARPMTTTLNTLDNLVFGNTIVPRGDGKWNGVTIVSSTITESWTLPTLPHGFLYYFDWATITVSGPAGPVLTIPSGEIIKLSYSRFEIGSNTEPGGLVADGVTFTSANDDLGGDTNGGTVSPNPGNWQRLDFNAMARADSCLITDCTFRYGGNGSGTIEVFDSEPRFERCDISLSSSAGAYVHGDDANPTFWYCSFTDNTQYGIRTTGGQAHVVHNCFVGNGTYGVLVEEVAPSSGSLLLTNCWWGAADGPSGEGAGSGDAVSAGVTFAPWATVQACADLPVGIDQDAPTVLTLRSAYPNPFNPSTTISFDLPATADMNLDVVDLQGRRVATLVAGELAAGRHDVRWFGRDDRGRHVPAGVYMFRMNTGGETRTGKLVLLK